jgi:hypothetical protein
MPSPPYPARFFAISHLAAHCVRHAPSGSTALSTALSSIPQQPISHGTTLPQLVFPSNIKLVPYYRTIMVSCKRASEDHRCIWGSIHATSYVSVGQVKNDVLACRLAHHADSLSIERCSAGMSVR